MLFHSKALLPATWLLLASSMVLAATAEAQPPAGDTTRNVFGPSLGTSPTLCRGACGAGCPSTCSSEIRYECLEGERLRKVKVYDCGTHQGCREHDQCLDTCAMNAAASMDCDAMCHSQAVERYGLENAVSWAAGNGPYEAQRLTFEYMRAAPTVPEPAYNCPQGSSLQCSGAVGRCLAGGSEVEPVFDAYPDAAPGTMRVSGLRAGPLCGSGDELRVCEHTTDIQVSGGDSCVAAGGSQPCTRYGVELDYSDADPGHPLACSASGGGSSDFLGGLIEKGLRAMPQQDAEAANGLGALLGQLQGALSNGGSLEEALSGISVTPHGPDGKPMPGAGVGGGTPVTPKVPSTVALNGASGRLVIPMYETLENSRGGRTVERELRCSQKGVPVLETTFRLHFR